MKRFAIAVGALALAALPCRAQGRALAVVGATIIDGTGGPPMANATIVIERGLIAAIGPSRNVRIPDGAQRIDAQGKFVLPGFVDVNVHLTPYNFAAAGIANWSDSGSIAGAIRGARALLRHGVTTARDSYGILPLLLAARDSMARDSLPAPRILFAGNVIGWGDIYSYTFSGGTGGRPRDSVTRRVSAALVQGVGENVIDLSADSLGAVIGRYIDAGPDFIKIGITTHTADPSPSLFTPRALAAMIAAAHSRNRKVDAHAGNFEALRAAALAGVDVLQHPEIVTHRMTEAEAREIAGTGTTCALMPRHTTGEGWAAFRAHVDAGGRMWPPEMPLARLRARNDSIRRTGVTPNTTPTQSIVAQEIVRANAVQLIRAGCRIAVATDDIAGSSREMGPATLTAIEGLVELGMTPMQAIVAATANGAVAAGGDKRFGSLAPGFAADLVVLTRNPLEQIGNIRSIEMVVVGGRVATSLPASRAPADTTVVLGQYERDLTGDGRSEVLRLVGRGPTIDSLNVRLTIEDGRRVIYEVEFAPLTRSVRDHLGRRRLSDAEHREQLRDFGKWLFEPGHFATPAEYLVQMRSNYPRNPPVVPPLVDRATWREIANSKAVVFSFSRGGDNAEDIVWHARAGRFIRLIDCC